jgi:flagellin
VAAGAANMTAHALDLGDTRIDTKESAVMNLPKIDSATNRLSGFRSYLGGVQSNLLEHHRDLDIHRTNLSHANSRIRDADYAEWSAENIKQSVLEQANVSVLAQANTVAQTAVRLLEKA